MSVILGGAVRRIVPMRLGDKMGIHIIPRSTATTHNGAHQPLA